MRIGCQVGTWKGCDVEAAIRGIGTMGVQGVETFCTQLEPRRPPTPRARPAWTIPRGSSRTAFRSMRARSTACG